MERNDRRLLEDQIYNIEMIMNQMTLMRSTLVRRVARMNRERRQDAGPVVPAGPAVRRGNGRGRGRPRREPIVIEDDPAPPPQIRAVIEDEHNHQHEHVPMEIVDDFDERAQHFADQEFADLLMVIDNVLVQEEMMEYNDENVVPYGGRVRRIRPPTIKLKVIKRCELEKTMEEACTVCCNDYQKKDAITPECNHDICRTCFDTWQQTKLQNGESVTCPICRILIKKAVGYRERAARTARAAAVVP
jgi:hypothetical protein